MPGRLGQLTIHMAEFYDKRMELLGVMPENNKIRLYNPEAQHPMPKWSEAKIFSEDVNSGDIEILYYTLDAEAIIYYNDNKTPAPRFYKTRRLREPVGDMKYRMPKGQGTFPWFHPQFIQSYQDGTPVPIVYLTEGVFKAWKACQAGLPTVGLSSITHYSDHDGNLYRDLVRFIEKCQVRHLVVLWDGDCLNVSPKAISVREELTKRPSGFYSAAKKIRELVRGLKIEGMEAPNVHFMHVVPESLQGKPKGLDDMLIEAEKDNKAAAIVQDALAIDKKGPYFFKLDITNATTRLREYFRLHDADEFYRLHSDTIGEAEFFYFGSLYYYDSTNEKVKMIAPSWAKDLRWIGDEFFVERIVPGARGDRRVLLKWSKETMKDLYGKNFLQHLTHFDAFCNVPNHWEYQQVVERDNQKYYNRYFPFKHIPEHGEDYYKIIEFIKHIFGTHQVRHGITGAMIDSWELGLDYIQLLLCEPQQALPVLCLYSQENNTGKSTFGKLLAHILGDNAIQIGNQDLQSDFNEVYSDKLLAICEETLLDRKKDVERIKALSTSDQITVNPKGQKQYTIDFFCKFQFYSNNRRMIYVTKHDERFWIIKVPKAGTDNPNLLAEMKEQVPHFLHFIKNRELATTRDSRMHFHHSLIRTETFEEVVEVNEPADATDLREALSEMFMQMPDVQVIEMPLREVITEFFKTNTSQRWVQEILKDYLSVDLKRDADGVAVFERGFYYKSVWSELGQDFSTIKVQWRGRPYVFPREKFMREVVRVGDGATTPTDDFEPDPADVDRMRAALAGSQEDLPF